MAPLTLAQQALALRGRFPIALVRLSATSLRFIGELTPSPLSRTYTVAIGCQPGQRPKVTVLTPHLERPPDTELPHTYENDELCLHLPDEWTPRMLIATTTVPWTSEWLFHYEVWLATDGTWCGGGHS